MARPKRKAGTPVTQLHIKVSTKAADQFNEIIAYYSEDDYQATQAWVLEKAIAMLHVSTFGLPKPNSTTK